MLLEPETVNIGYLGPLPLFIEPKPNPHPQQKDQQRLDGGLAGFRARPEGSKDMNEDFGAQSTSTADQLELQASTTAHPQRRTTKGLIKGYPDPHVGWGHVRTAWVHVVLGSTIHCSLCYIVGLRCCAPTLPSVFWA